MDNTLIIQGDTICAPATPPVNSAIAVIRISGPRSHTIVTSILQKKQREHKERYAYLDSIVYEDRIIDDVIIIFYKSPRSYTGEDLVELFCHGNQLIVYNILYCLQENGARIAEPGEFTKIAFLNGKMDLTEAEAVNHLIHAKSDWELSAAIQQMHGSFRNIILKLRSEIILLKADIECSIDFIEEDISFITYEKALNGIQLVSESVQETLKRCNNGEKLCHGIDIAIIGKPNVGKSSILNYLLNKERAIVSDIPGTTRDTIKEPIQIGGIHFNLIDTAGIDTPANEIEKIGIDKSFQNIKEASIIFVVFDGSIGFQEEDLKVLTSVHGKNCIYLINKNDIAISERINDILDHLTKEPVLISVKTGEGFDEVKSKIIDYISKSFIDIKHSFIADLRIIGLLEKALTVIINIEKLMINKEPVEIIVSELQAVIEYLSDIVGEITPDEVLNSIFGRFCIGK